MPAVNFEPTASIDHKQGNTFRLAGIFKNDDGSLLDLTGYKLTAHIRNARDAKICDVIIKQLDNGFLEFSLPAHVILPLGTLYLDILTEVTISGQPVERNTDICEINVKRVVTHG